MLQFVNDFNQGIFILLTVIYLYQLYYLFVSLTARRRKNPLPAKPRKITNTRPSLPHATKAL